MDRRAQASRPRVPSSGSAGFFQEKPVIGNQARADEVFERTLRLFLPAHVLSAVRPDLDRFGSLVLSKQVMDWVTDAEANLPYLRGSGYDAFGRRTDELITGEGWRRLQDLGFEEGIVAAGYENRFGQYDRVVQFLKGHLWSASCASVACPSAMQDGAAAIITKQLADSEVDSDTRKVLSAALEHLKSRDPARAWTSGQWMTERKGGSDVSGTETLATYAGTVHGARDIDGSPLGPWQLDGFKWFSSATDCQMSVALAQTEKGLSCFYAPMRRTVDGIEGSEMNGVRIQRLKNKLGTRSLPTAELELSGMRAWLVGREGEGVKNIATMLNITRLHNAVTSVGVTGRGLAISRAYAKVRKLNNGLALRDVPLFAKTISKVATEYRANMLLTYFVAYLLGITENATASSPEESHALYRLTSPSPKGNALLLRLLGPIMKGRTAKASIRSLQETMESLGGVGYLENSESQEINVARLFRDANVLSIWEGTTDIMATDTVKVLKSRSSDAVCEAMQAWIGHALDTKGAHPAAPDLAPAKSELRSRWNDFKNSTLPRPTEDLVASAREVMQFLGDLVCGLLLLVDAESDGDAVAAEVCRSFVASRFSAARPACSIDGASSWDKKIAFGTGREGVVDGSSRL